MKTLAATWTVLLLAGLGACGGADQSPPRSVDNDGRTEEKAGAAKGGLPPPGMYAQPLPGPMPPPPPSQPPQREIRTVDEGELALADDERTLDQILGSTELSTMCYQVCAAIASMRRSVGALCELAGDGDDRCKRARSRLEAGEKRVASSGCRC